jgi:hypothetical protein
MAEIRALWTPERCTRTREMGHDLRLLLNLQLKDYKHPGGEKLTRPDKVRQATDFIVGVAVMFEQKVHPGTLDALNSASNQSTQPPR